MRLVLASASPRRHELMALTQVAFEIAEADLDETPQPGESGLMLVQRLALAKARFVQSQQNTSDETWYLGCDTVVVCAEQMLGKPRDFEEARHMLRSLSGETHQVMTGIALVGPQGWLRERQYCTEVHFHVLSDEDIAAYWATGEPQDKAGAYAIQGYGARFVKHMEGQFHAVMGLPVDGVVQLLQQAGFDTWARAKES